MDIVNIKERTKIVKITTHGKQVRMTIPKDFAEDFVKAGYAIIEAHRYRGNEIMLNIRPAKLAD